MSTFGSIWANRSITLAAPKSGEHDDQIAPRLGGGEHRDERLGDGGQEGGHAVAAGHAEGAQPRLDAGDLSGELAIAERAAWPSSDRKITAVAAGIGLRRPRARRGRS